MSTRPKSASPPIDQDSVTAPRPAPIALRRAGSKPNTFTIQAHFNGRLTKSKLRRFAAQASKKTRWGVASPPTVFHADREVSGGSLTSRLINPRFDAGQAEVHYQALGRFKGRLAALEIQRAAEQFWLGSGREGAAWLVERLRSETHVDPLNAAGSFLADLGPMAVGPIFEALVNDPAEDQGIALLKALGWMAEKSSTTRVAGGRLESVIVLFLNDNLADLREAAARAALLLPSDRAVHWLKFRLALEQDGDVELTIRDGLGHLGLVEV